MSRRAVAYIRTSGLGQVDREGPKVQEDDCRRYAASHGMTVVAVLHEKATTGETDDRPAYAEALVMVEQSEADVILIATRSRLARNLMVQEALLRRAWDLSIEVHDSDYGLIPEDDPDDPTRTFVRLMLGAVAQLDKAVTVQRLRKARMKKALPGKREYVGRKPFGYGRDADREQAVLSFITARHDAGDSWEWIAAGLNNRPGWHNRTGGEWTPVNVRRVHRRTSIA